MSLFSEVSLPALFSGSIKAGFSGFGLLRRGFNEVYLTIFDLIKSFGSYKWFDLVR